MQQVADTIDGFVEEKQTKTFASLQYIGEEIVNKARNTDTYRDKTGNLRSSIGYAVIYNGKLVTRNIEQSPGKGTDKQTGVKTSKNLTDELASLYNLEGQYDIGFVLVVFAGMEYAAAVESRNYDVITGSLPTDSNLAKILKEFISD